VSRALTSAATWMPLITLVVLSVAPPLVGAQGSEGLTPSFGDGRLTLTGAGFRPNERITVSVRVGDARHEFTVTADPRGRFRLATGLSVPHGSSVRVDARGDQGTTQATITSAPGALPGQPSPATAPPVIPETGSGALVIVGLIVLGALRVARSAWRHRS
jgi:hypothetical protein